MQPHLSSAQDVRVDPYTETRVYVVGSRQARPNLPNTGCPFCVGGLESPDPYDLKTFPNRWPAMPGDRCEVVLYTSVHDATFPGLGVHGVRKVVDLWAERTATLGAREDVAYVFIFENRGPEVGATIAHPHGQLYAFDHVPARPAELLANGWAPDPDPGDRLVFDMDGWMAWVPDAPVHPIAVTLAPTTRRADLATLDDVSRDGLAAALVRLLSAFDALFAQPLPYMMWINQRPSDGTHSDAWLNLEFVSPWRRAGVQRFIAAAEVGTGEYFNPVIPEVIAEQLREALSRSDKQRLG